MVKELEISYPRLKRDWGRAGGKVIRLSNEYIKGIPDFCLFHPTCGAIFGEVKSVQWKGDNIGLEIHQANELDEIHKYGGRGRVLVWCIDEDMWGIFYANGEFLTTFWKFLTFDMAPMKVETLSWQNVFSPGAGGIR